MAKKPSKSIPEFVQVPIKWNMEGMPVVFANQMLVNSDDHEVHLHFFEITPPVIVGTDEQKQKQLEDLKSVSARGVVRVIVSKDRLPAFIQALQSTSEKIEARQSQTVNGKDRKDK